jgi:hypothetical protein
MVDNPKIPASFRTKSLLSDCSILYREKAGQSFTGLGIPVL